jgi:hypothetical protein
MLHNRETYLVVNDALKAVTPWHAMALQVSIMELNKLNLLSSLVKAIMMSKSTGYICGREKSAEDILVTDCMASGVKGAGT